MREWLRASRKEKGFTAAEMGKELGISESYYCMIENGERQKKMDITLLSLIAQVLDKPITEIIRMETERK